MRNCPDFTVEPSPDEPVYRLHTIEPYEEFEVLGYKAKLVPVPHAVPAAGVQVSANGVSLFYTGDTGRGLSDAWQHVRPDVLLTEVTYGNENDAKAHQVGHLTSALLGDSLRDFKAALDYLPIVIASHVNPLWETAVRSELKDLSRDLGIEIIIAEADQTLHL